MNLNLKKEGDSLGNVLLIGETSTVGACDIGVNALPFFRPTIRHRVDQRRIWGVEQGQCHIVDPSLPNQIKAKKGF